MRISGYYSALITPHHAYLVHALGRTGRAIKYYRVAAFLASASHLEAGEEVVGGKLALVRGWGDWADDWAARAGGGAGLDGETREMGREVVLVSRDGRDAQAIEASLSDEIVKSKYAPTPNPLTHAKNNLTNYLNLQIPRNTALGSTSLSRNNHLRAVVLCTRILVPRRTTRERPKGELKKWGGTEVELEAAAAGNVPLRLSVGVRQLGALSVLSFYLHY